jgi:hypothetical protein
MRLFIGRTGDLRIEVANQSGKPMRHVAIVAHLPEGVEFVAANEQGNYQPNARAVNWLLDSLPAGQTHPVFLRVQPSAPGQLACAIAARADGVQESKAMAALAVEGVADLIVNLQGEQALEVGKDTVYVVRLGNPGSGPNSNVQVEVTFSPGLVPVKALAPTTYRIDGQTVIFDPLPLLAPNGGQAMFQIRASGQGAGECRVRASVTSAQVGAPIVREMGTRVYRD